MLIVTNRPVRKGEQLLWYYGGCIDDADNDSEAIADDYVTSSQSQPWSQSQEEDRPVSGGGVGDTQRGGACGVVGGSGPVAGSGVHGGGRCSGIRGDITPPQLLQRRVGIVFKQASSDTSGSCGGCGFGGSIAPKGMYDVFEATELRGRAIVDLGAGNGRVLMAAAFYGASNGWGWELGVNKGNFSIYNAALCIMAKDKVLQHCRRGFNLSEALIPGDIDQVLAYVEGCLSATRY